MLNFCTKKSQKSQFSKFSKTILNHFIKNLSSSFVTTDQIRRFPASEVHYHAHYMLKTLHKFILLREPLATTNLWYVISRVADNPPPIMCVEGPQGTRLVQALYGREAPSKTSQGCVGAKRPQGNWRPHKVMKAWSALKVVESCTRSEGLKAPSRWFYTPQWHEKSNLNRVTVPWPNFKML